MEKVSRVQNSELWNKIYDIVSQLQPKQIEGDHLDIRSATTKLEKLFKSNQL